MKCWKCGAGQAGDSEMRTALERIANDEVTWGEAVKLARAALEIADRSVGYNSRDVELRYEI